MENKMIKKRKSHDIQERVSIESITHIIEKYIQEDNNFSKEIGNNIIKIIGKLDYFLNKRLIPNNYFLKIERCSKLINKNNYASLKYNNNVIKMIFKQQAIFSVSIFLLRKYINNRNHYQIIKYLKLLLFFYLNGGISLDYFFFILETILKALIELLKKRSSNKLQICEITEEPLFFINDIIEAIITFPIIMLKNNEFIEHLINLFNKFLELAEKENIIIKESELWLKLLENNSLDESLKLPLDESYKDSIKQIIDFLYDIYKNNIPNKFYNEIYKKSTIDILYYINALSLIKELIKTEKGEIKTMNIDKGAFLLGTNYTKDHLSFPSTNEFSVILSFQILNDITGTLSILHIIQKNKNNIFHILIKSDTLNIEINNDLKWNTNIKIEKKIFYLIFITYNKKNKALRLYLNSNDEIPKTKAKLKKLEKSNASIPKFAKEMESIIGDINLYAIIGDVFFINKELDLLFIHNLFNSEEYYSNLIIRNNVKCDLVKNNNNPYNGTGEKNIFRSVKYDYTLLFTPNVLLFKDDDSKDSFLEYNGIKNYTEFINSKGIEFLSFMLHNIKSKINNSEILNIYLFNIFDLLSCLLDNENIHDKNNIYEFGDEEMKNQLNIFSITLLTILKSYKEEQKQNFGNLSDDIWYSLLKIFSLDIKNSNTYKQMILSVLLDYDLFDQKKYISDFNDSLDKIKPEILNNEILYKIFLNDFIFVSDSINHKNFLNLINGLIKTKNKDYCKALINYVTKIDNEIINYHYFRIIYKNIQNLKSILSTDIKHLNGFIENKLQTLDHFHCKYCSYLIILFYLIKQDLILNNPEDRNDIFLCNKYLYMYNPSYLFLRSIFIENFKLDNAKKLEFIKSKKKNSYFNKDIFKKKDFHPFELYEVKKFLVRFDSIIKYVVFLMNLEQNENLKSVIDYFFCFFCDFAEKINDRYSKNVFINVETEKSVNEFYSSEEFYNFFILYIKHDENKALEEMKKLINTSFFKYIDPFYFRYLLPDYVIKDKNCSNDIKSKIINYIFEVIFNFKKDKKDKKEKKEKFENIFLFITILYKIFYEKEIKHKLSRDYPLLLNRLFSFLKDKNLLLYNDLIDISYFDDNNDLNNESNNKLACEMMFDIIFKFYFRGNYSNEIINLLIKNPNSSTSIFYNDDNVMFSSKEKNKVEDDDDSYDDEYEDNPTKIYSFLEGVGEFSFCIYFLVYFLEKELICQEKEKNTINDILQAILNDLKKLYTKNKKASNKLKKIKNKGKIFDIYNEILDYINKNIKNENCNLIALKEKYNQIINQIKNTKEKEVNNNFHDINDKQKLEGNMFESKTEKFIDKKAINNDIPINSINLDSKNQIDYHNINKNKNGNISPMNYLKEKLAKMNYIDLYMKLIVGNDYSKKLTQILFNPKGYYLWNKFTCFVQDYMFFNKKFRKIGKTFSSYINQGDNITNYKYKENNNCYLNYPTKIRNYITDEYYRPFLKPHRNFFNSNFLKISHKYISLQKLQKIEYKEEYFNKIKYLSIIPKLKQEKYYCELIKNRGNIFGYIQLENNFLIFKNSPNDDTRLSDDPQKCLPFIFSIEDEKVIDKDKNVLIYYEDIKEIIKRRFCLIYIALEFFTKDNRSYMFNFFDKKVIDKFIKELKLYTIDKNKPLKTAFTVTDSSKKLVSKKTFSISNINDIVSNVNNNIQNESDINFKLIEDPIFEFKKIHLKSKFKKGDLSNFNYLLLLNKYSSRTYNDYNQYLVFPLLFLDQEHEKKRDLSKVISLNKENNESSYEKAKSNYSILKYHFNQHYTAGGFILFYLVRLIPFTYQHILFQSNKFDTPNRLFSAINNIFLFFQITDDNRELIPEFYYSYEFLLNLNYNDFGVLSTSEENYHINNVNVNCKYAIPEYIINARNNLEQIDLSPWIDNIFGSKQASTSIEQPNLFPLHSYEEFSELETIMQEDEPIQEKVSRIREQIDLLKFGITPAKLFSKPHEKMNIKTTNINEDDFNNYETMEKKMLNIINKFIQKKIKEKVDFYLINTNNISDIELIFKFRNKIDIFKLKYGYKKNTDISLSIQEQINSDSFNNSFCEILPEIYCLVRNIDNTISFHYKNKTISVYHFNCLITSVENKYNKNAEYKTNKEIFIGDENGFLHLIEIEIIQNEKICEIKNIKIKKTSKVHEGYIKGLLHNERLNIVFSWSDEHEDYICLNNDYSLSLINLIKIEKNNTIRELLVSKYDLIYVSCYNKITQNYSVHCYTLNGVKVSFFEGHEKIVKCFVNNKINILFTNNNGISFHLYTFDDTSNNFFCDFEENNKPKIVSIKNCQYYPQIKKYLIICTDNKAYFYNNDGDYI